MNRAPGTHSRQLLLVLVGALSSMACIRMTCRVDDEDEFMTYRAGRTNAAGTFYETNGPNEPFLHFPAERSYDLVHGLSDLPAVYHAYLSFTACPNSELVGSGKNQHCAEITGNSKGGGMVETAGNHAIFELRSPDVLRVTNDTCAEMYVRVVAMTFIEPPASSDDDPDAGSAGTP